MMKAQSSSQPAKARCYQCGSADIIGVCHHCGRGICPKHVIEDFPKPIGFVRSLFVKLNLIKSPDAGRFYNEPTPHINLLEEFLITFKIAEVCNTEFKGFQPPEYPGIDLYDYLKMSYLGRPIPFRYLLGMDINHSIATGSTKKSPEAQIHCKYCTHYMIRIPLLGPFNLIPPLILLGSLGFIMGTLWIFGYLPLPEWLLQTNDPLISLVMAFTFAVFVFFLAVVVFLLSLYVNYRFYWTNQVVTFPPVPIEGQLDPISTSESGSGSIRLDAEGVYTPQFGEMKGKLLAPLRFSQADLSRYRAYHQRAQWLGVTNVFEKEVLSGYLLLGPADWRFLKQEVWEPHAVNIVRLSIPHKDGPLDWLLQNPDKVEKAWPIEYEYSVLDGTKDTNASRLPLQVILSMRSASNRQGLELELEYTGKVAGQTPKVTIEQLDLWVPEYLGYIERHDPAGRIHQDKGSITSLPGMWQRITWRNLILASEQNYRQTVYIRFQNPIEPQTRLQGKMIIKIPAAFSGLAEVGFFTPWGTKRKVKFNPETRLDISLDLDLSRLKHQSRISQETKITGKGVVPNSDLVLKIARCLSQEGFYLKHIIENPARTSRDSAYQIYRYWDLGGRNYEGISPVDFHMVLLGSETHNKSKNIANSGTEVQITVQGVVTSDEMAAHVQDVFDRLVNLVKSTLS